MGETADQHHVENITKTRHLLHLIQKIIHFANIVLSHDPAIYRFSALQPPAHIVGSLIKQNALLSAVALVAHGMGTIPASRLAN